MLVPVVLGRVDFMIGKPRRLRVQREVSFCFGTKER